MLSKLKYKVKFKATGKQLAGHIAFAGGLSGISGPNEAGKSTVLELIRFALFGTSALRAPLKEYIEIDVTLDFLVKDHPYRVHRTKSSAEVYHLVGPGGWETAAAGVSPVNQYIERVFGYGLNVFDIAHYCGQGQVEALTNMPAKQRKEMVDRVIGMEALDAAADEAAAKRTTLAAELKGLRAGLGSRPQPPTPHGGRGSAAVQQVLDEAEATVQQFQQDRAWLARPEPPEPQKPINPAGPGMTAAKMREYQSARGRVLELAEKLRTEIGGVPAAIYTAEQLDKFEDQLKRCCDWMDQCTFVEKHGEFPWWVTPEQLNWVPEAAELAERFKQAYDRYVSYKSPTVDCDNCGTTIVLDKAKVERLEMDAVEAQEAEQAFLKGKKVPKITPWQAAVITAAHRAWAKRVLPYVPWVPMPPINDIGIKEQRRALATQPQRDQLAALKIPEDHSDDLRAREHYEAQYEIYENAREAYDAWQAEAATRRRRMQENAEIEGFVKSLRLEKEAALGYESAYKVYEAELKRYETVSEQVVTLEAEVDQWQRACDAIKTMRTRVKLYLVPSLNAAASQLLSQMTGGVRQTIQVSETFETILVDGQPLETLSGSAKAVANLSIRLGLGRVLTNSVFSVFMGDEIDASMDSDRAGNTAACLTSLGGTIKQIILVSHKDLDVQHRITIC